METNKNNIFLVPTDFSEVCAKAANRAASAAKELDYKVALLHVIDKHSHADLKNKGKGQEFIMEQLNELSNSLINKYGVEVEVMAREGDIFSTISEVAEDLKANLIFLGTHGKVGMQKITGSFALRVITSSETPTIVVHNRVFEGGFNKIVVPITSDAGPWSKTKWAAAIAQEYNAEIHVYHLPSDALDDVMTMITNHFKANDVKYVVKVAEKGSNFTKQVVDYSTSVGADLIMIMTNPEKGFKTYLLGSYDEELIFNTSQIPVMAINPRDFNWKKIIPR
jgi:nucleotide-binding universal stress UspA family protein